MHSWCRCRACTAEELLVRRGNPLFLEETIRTLAETKVLAGERGRYRLMQPVQTIHVPPTVQVMLAARIDRLSSEDKRLLQVASVVGKDVPLALLQAIAELSEEALRCGLDHLQAAELLFETGLYPDLEYSFKHDLTHDVTYAGLPGGASSHTARADRRRNRSDLPRTAKRRDRAACPSRHSGRTAGESGALSPASRPQGCSAVSGPGRPSLV